MEENKKEESCCGSKKKGEGFWSGLLYGLIPHTGCIAFILFTILGVTTLTAVFRPMLMSRYFFWGLMLLSFVFATLSAGFYLHKRHLLNSAGIKKKWKYLTTLYTTSIGINIILFMFIFPIAANMTGAAVIAGDVSHLKISVDIPCPGHAPLITESVKEVEGVKSVQFSFPNNFDIDYDSSETSKEEILAIDVFEPYPATVTSESVVENEITGDSIQESSVEKPLGCSNCGSCSGACGGSCSG